MKGLLATWQVWALGSAVFAALTAIFAKIGIAHVNSDFATFVRTVVILLALALMLTLAGQKLDFPHSLGPCDRRLLALLFPCVADRQGRRGRARRQALRRAGRRLRRPVPRRAAFRGPLAGRRHDRRRRPAAGFAYMRRAFFNSL